MSALDRGLRRELAKSVRRARKTAEAGARKALTALTVAAAEPDSSLSAEERALRRQLRAHGRQLGDHRQGAKQEVSRLAHEIAYEHWHRMLFARFLAENRLLVEPVHEVPVSLDECRDIARESRRDIWAVAAEFAAAMLPRIFRPDDPSLAVRLPPETQRELERTLAGLPSAVFLADDALGWTYQFWQADQKDEVNRSGVKIGGDELPAVTQLFTEPYMVRFLFHNTVGAWRAGRLLADSPEIAVTAESEDDLRRTVRLEAEGGYDFDFLRFVRQASNGMSDGNASGLWRPAAGSFGKWPNRAAELRVLDPCCGSGHFLVEGLHLFVRLRMQEEHLPLNEAIRAVLRDNLRGLEIDPRCAQIAAFSVAFAAWKLAGRAIELPRLRIACSGLAPNATQEQWLTLAEQAASAAGSAPRRGLHNTRQTLTSSALRHTFKTLHGLFAEAPILGSLVDPHHTDIFAKSFDDIPPLLTVVLAGSDADPEHRERTVSAAGIAEAGRLLADTYSLVITNVPYLGRGKQVESLRQFAKSRFPTALSDLASIFMERCFTWTGESGTEAIVVPQNVLFLTAYRHLRESLLTQRRWRLVAQLGEHAFSDPAAAGAFAAMTVISADRPGQGWRMAGIDVSAPRGQNPILAPAKATLLRGDLHSTAGSSDGLSERQLQFTAQRDQLSVPDVRISLSGSHRGTFLGNYASGVHGLGSKDTACFFRQAWELENIGPGKRWEFLQTAVDESGHFGGMEQAILWENGQGVLAERGRHGHAVLAGKMAWGKRGVLISQVGELSASLYGGHFYNKNAAAIVPAEDHVSAIWSFCSSPDYAKLVREIDQKLYVTNSTLVKVPFNLGHWRSVAAKKYPSGLPDPYSDDPTQWIFHGHPCGSVAWDEEEKRTTDGPTRANPTVLQVATARLLGYRWPAERDTEMHLADQQRAWVEKCADLDQLADEDGIVCLPAVRGEPPAADRLRELLVAAYQDRWSPATEQQLLSAASTDGRPVESLNEWLRDRFFAEHCRLFHHRPFVWHIWDGLPDGFHALVNYHRLAGPDGQGRRTLDALTFSYLGDWIDRQRAAQREETGGAEARLAAALELQGQLEHILEGESPLDLFIRWKPLHRQSLGWEPDLDDGVRLNIRPFMRAKLRKGGRRGAGLLRARPTIHWKKDRGKEPLRLRARPKGDSSEEIRPETDFPWFWSCPGTGTENERTDFMGGTEFDGSRWNDLHYTLAVKRAARERHERDAADKPAEDAVAGGAGTEGKTA